MVAEAPAKKPVKPPAAKKRCANSIDEESNDDSHDDDSSDEDSSDNCEGDSSDE